MGIGQAPWTAVSSVVSTCSHIGIAIIFVFSFFPVKSNREISIKYSRVFYNFSFSIFFKEDALNFAATVGYPCLLRPSYVLRYQLTH